MKVLSLFDGMACGALALQAAGIEIESYDAFEIDKYATQTASHNLPFINQHGDVFQADFTEFEGVDLLCGGSPCTYWSIAQKNNRETEASGMGWELFSQYVRALREAKPKYFVYENNKSMSKAIRASIDDTFGFEAVGINSALVSAQNRQRLYWCGARQPDGTYKKVDTPQPEDKGILLKDILEQGSDPVRIPEYGIADKSRPVTACYAYKGSGEGSLASEAFPDNPSKQVRDYIAEPVTDFVGIGYRGRMKNGRWEKRFEAREDKKANALTTATGDSMCTIRVGTWPNNAKNQDHDSQPYRVYSTEGKGVTLCGNGGGMGTKTGLYAIPCCDANGYALTCEWDESGKPTKAVSAADGKAYAVYEVKDGKITIKGKQYSIKLADGFYIIRKLTVRECMRLQTVPEWYEFPVSDSQAYKMLGNGFTIAVIAHILKGLKEA